MGVRRPLETAEPERAVFDFPVACSSDHGRYAGRVFFISRSRTSSGLRRYMYTSSEASYSLGLLMGGLQ